MKHILITGCTRGLGLAMARGFAARGWTVSGCGTNASAAAALGKELGHKHSITRSGVVVNFSSGWGRSTSPEVAPYCCSKWGIEGLTQALAQELPEGLAAVTLNPGIIDTDMLRSSFGAASSAYPDPAHWAIKVVPFLEKLAAKDNGGALTAPQ